MIIFAGYLRLAMIEWTFENYQQRHEQNHETVMGFWSIEAQRRQRRWRIWPSTVKDEPTLDPTQANLTDGLTVSLTVLMTLTMVNHQMFAVSPRNWQVLVPCPTCCWWRAYGGRPPWAILVHCLTSGCKLSSPSPSNFGYEGTLPQLTPPCEQWRAVSQYELLSILPNISAGLCAMLKIWLIPHDAWCIRRIGFAPSLLNCWVVTVVTWF